jgi:hypothetical protein
VSSAHPLDVFGCKGNRSRPAVSLQDPDGLRAAPPREGRLSLRLEAEVEPVKNPVERTATVAEELRRPAVSAEPQVVAAVSSEPQVFGAAPFSMATCPERIWGTFNLTRQEEADEMIKRISAMKAFLKPE